MKAQTLLQCSYCGKWFKTQSKKQITGITMMLKDGTKVNACYDCICKIGRQELKPEDYQKEM